MTRSLVTGAAGFLGSHVCEALLARGDEVCGVDSFTEYYDPALKRANLATALAAGLSFRQLDLCSDGLDELLRGVDVVFHLAGQPGVRPSWGEDFAVYAQRNVVATQRLLEASTRAGVGRFVFASSSSVYGESDGRAMRESTRRRPVSPYGLTKSACEDLVDVYRRTNGLSAVSLRYFTIYGPRQRPEMAFATFIRCVLEGKAVPVLGDGRQTRDFTYVSDAVAATLAAAERGDSQVYNVSGGASASVLKALDEIELLTGRRAIVELGRAARGDARHTRADLGLAAHELRYRPTVGLREGLARQIDAYAAGDEPLEAVA